MNKPETQFGGSLEPVGSESAVDMSLVPHEGLYTHPTIRLWDGAHEIWISRKTPTHVSFMARQGERSFGRFKWSVAEFMAGRENYIPNVRHQRWEPAAEDARIVSGLAGWLPSAVCRG